MENQYKLTPSFFFNASQQLQIHFLKIHQTSLNMNSVVFHLLFLIQAVFLGKHTSLLWQMQSGALGTVVLRKWMTNVHYVLDGGSLLQRIPWTKGDLFSTTCITYVNYVTKKYPKLTVAFDGYPDTPSTKDITHMRRTRGVTSPKVTFNENMLCKTKKEVFLSNTDNKRSFLNLLSTKLCENGCTAINAKEDADVLIVQTALELANTCDVVLIGEDTNLLVLLCYHADIHSNRIYFKSESKQEAVARKNRVWDITKTKIVLGEEICRLLPALHVMTGYDRKRSCAKKVDIFKQFQETCQYFLDYL